MITFKYIEYTKIIKDLSNKDNIGEIIKFLNIISGIQLIFINYIFISFLIYS